MRERINASRGGLGRIMAGVVLIGAAAAAPAAGQTVFLTPERALVGAFHTALVEVPGDNRLIALDLTGRVRIVTKGQDLPLATPALDFSNQVPQFGDENGAVGLALHPNFTTNRFMYVFHSRINAGPVIVRYTVPAAGTGPIDANTRQVIMTFPSFSAIHVGGWIGFGPDGLLYITHGDNGAQGNAQNTSTVKGKILRINVDADDFPNDPDRNYAIPPGNAAGLNVAPEIWCIGVRNPYRCSFDMATGEFYFGDVGDSLREELDRLPASAWQQPGGVNFGWPCFEGNLVRATSGCDYSVFPYAPPIADFTRTQLSCIIGGYVYRGCGVPALQGRYIFGNCATFNQILSIDPNNLAAGFIRHPVSPSGIGQPLGFAQGLSGEVYVLAGSGVFRINGLGAAGQDCNGNQTPDLCELQAGTATDLNNDGTLDVCTQICPTDVNGSGAVTVQDVFDFLALWFAQRPVADFNQLGGVTIQDIFDFLSAWFAGC